MEGVFVARVADLVEGATTLPRRTQEQEAVKRLLEQLLPHGKLSHTAEGAPYIEGCSGTISISHSTDFVALFLSSTARHIGIDIESKYAKVLRVAPRFMDDKELKALSKLRTHCEQERFATIIWCAKEATFKYFRSAHPDFRAYYHTLFLDSIIPFHKEESKQTLQLHYSHPTTSSARLSITVEQKELYTLAYLSDTQASTAL